MPHEAMLLDLGEAVGTLGLAIQLGSGRQVSGCYCQEWGPCCFLASAQV